MNLSSGFLAASVVLLQVSAAAANPILLDESGDLEILAPDQRIELNPLVVVASKSPRSLSEIAAQVTIIDAEHLGIGRVEDLDGMLKYQPGLEMETAGTRFGAKSINIRGIGGNRVAIEIDGIPVRDRFAIGAFSDGGRTLVEPDRIKQVEVLYGPASVMYGSNALGGVMAIATWDPSDLLIRSDRSAALGLRGAYQASNQSWVGSAIAAWGEGAHGLLAAATYRKGHELDNRAPAEMPADPQDWDSTDYMFRYTYDTAAGNRLRLTAATTDRRVKTDMNSQLGYGRRFRNTTAMLADDQDESQRVSLDYDFSFGGWRQGTIRVYGLNYDTDQFTRETRGTASPPVEIRRRFLYGQDITGMDLNLFREVDTSWSMHRLGLGAEWVRKDVKEMRDGLQTSLLDGTNTSVILGEELPVRDFPSSRTDEYSVFVQDEINLAGGAWELIPALRWDRYELDPRPDSIWEEDNPDTPVVSVDASRLTPRLGLVYHITAGWTAYGQYSHGFRAPPFEDANIGLDIPLFGFRAIPNPDLESETSNGIELGLRRISGGSRFSLAAFYTDYDNFIESRALIGRDPDSGDLIFQSRNIDQARIYGLDIRYDKDLTDWLESLQGWMLTFAAYWAKGENRESDQPLNTIAPSQAVLGLNWVSRDRAWDFAASGTFTAAKHNSDIDASGGERFATPSWVILDLTAGWHPVDRLELRAGIFNLFNHKYWRWLDVSNLEADDPMIPLLSRPGRNFSASVRLSF